MLFPVLISYGSVRLRSFSSFVTGLPNTIHENSITVVSASYLSVRKTCILCNTFAITSMWKIGTRIPPATTNRHLPVGTNGTIQINNTLACLLKDSSHGTESLASIINTSLLASEFKVLILPLISICTAWIHLTWTQRSSSFSIGWRTASFFTNPLPFNLHYWPGAQDHSYRAQGNSPSWGIAFIFSSTRELQYQILQLFSFQNLWGGTWTLPWLNLTITLSLRFLYSLVQWLILTLDKMSVPVYNPYIHWHHRQRAACESGQHGIILCWHARVLEPIFHCACPSLRTIVFQ